MMFASPVLYRVLQQPEPRRLPDIAADEFRYGARILYMEGPAPAEPVRVDGLVVHSTVAETAHFVGSSNPILEHLGALQRIENDKYFEAEMVRSVAPDACARTELVSAVWPRPSGIAPEAYLAWLEHAMRERYPQGFVLKPLASFSTDGKFPSDGTPFVALWKAYKAEAEPRIAELAAAGTEPTELHLRMKAVPSYPGRILDAVLTAPETVMIQARLDIAETDGVVEEYRVHVVGGRVLCGATQHRWGRWTTPRARLREAEAFVQRIVCALPPPYDVLTYGVDVVALSDGSLAFMEGNAGWESQYFYAEFDVWVANLFAAHYTGRPTPLLKQFRRFASAPGLAGKIAQLRKLLAHKALRGAAPDAMTEVLAQACWVLLDELRTRPTRAALARVTDASAELGLAPYVGELENLALTRVA